MIMSLFTYSLIPISGSLLVIQVNVVSTLIFLKWLFCRLLRFLYIYHPFQLHHGTIMPVLLPIISGIIALALVFIACEIGQQLNNTFDEINSTIAQFNWYLFPIKIKHVLPIIIPIAQQPVTLECFGSITCIRETFKNVCMN